MTRSLVVALLTVLAAAPHARALTFVVTDTSDARDVDPGDGVCETAAGNGVCTLRAAVMEADAQAAAQPLLENIIRLPPGTHRLTIPPPLDSDVTDDAANGDLDVTAGTLTIEASQPGATTPTVVAMSEGCADSGTPCTQETDCPVEDSCDPLSRLFEVHVGATVSISGITITGGTPGFRDSDFDGGGIRNAGTLSLRGVNVTGNRASQLGGGVSNVEGRLTIADSTIDDNDVFSFGVGGGIGNDGGDVTVSRSTVRGNSSEDEGGGLGNVVGTMTVEGCTVSGNSAPVGGGLLNQDRLVVRDSAVSENLADDEGGGLANRNGSIVLETSLVSGNAIVDPGGHGGGGVRNEGILDIRNCTLSGNQATFGGALSIGDFDSNDVVVGSQVTINNTTIAFNRASTSGGGIEEDSESRGIPTIGNSILAANTAGNSALAQCDGSVSTVGFNLFGDESCFAIVPEIAISGATDIVAADPGLDGLKDNGGPTLTHALRPDSPALDHANPGSSTTGAFLCEQTDQRGIRRPGGVACDIGAFEVSCGNGVLDAGEQCDDGNVAGGDCCSPTCTFEADGSPCTDDVFCNGTDTCRGGACTSHAGDPCVRGDGSCAATCDEDADSCFAEAGRAMMTLTDAASAGLVTLESKGCFTGDCMTLRATNAGTASGVLIRVAIGDVFLSRTYWGQNMVNLRPEEICIPQGATAARGLAVSCLDAKKGFPAAGDIFDVGPPVTRWLTRAGAGAELMRLLQAIDARQAWLEPFVSRAIWLVTDRIPLPDGVPAVRDLLAAAEIDPERLAGDFPHLTAAAVITGALSSVAAPREFGADGQCLLDLPDGPCDDGDPCTIDDGCNVGLCVSGARIDATISCNDGDACTVDTCGKGVGCAHEAQAASHAAGATCGVENLEHILVGTPSPGCTDRCFERLANAFIRVRTLIAAADEATSARRCRRRLNAALTMTTKLHGTIHRLATTGRVFSSPAQGEELEDEAERLLGRITAFRDGCAAK